MENIEDILSLLGIEKGSYYINEQGKVMKDGFVTDGFTGIYINDEGKIMKEKFPIDEYQGYYINEKGEIYKDGFVPTYTGFRLDEDGHFRKEGFITDKDTGYRIDENGHFRKEGFVIDGHDIDISQNPEQEMDTQYESGSDWLIKIGVYAAVIIFILYWVGEIFGRVIYYGVPVLPLLLIFYAWYKPTGRNVFIGMGLTAFALYNLISRGFVYEVWGSQLFYPAAVVYSIILAGFIYILTKRA